MIDIHTHILPGIDDGASSLDVSIAMLDGAVALGVDTVAATPHLPSALTPEYAGAVRDAFDRVAEPARERRIALVRGYEIRLTPDVPARLRDREPVTLGDTDVVLVDLPGSAWPPNVDEVLFNIQALGFQPVLAHPERYSGIQQRPETGRELVERGVGLQVTIGSFAGAFGRRTQRAAEALLKLGAVHLVASDAHSAGDRLAAMPAGLARLEQMVSADDLRRLTEETPAALLRGDALPEPVAGKSRRSRFGLGRVLRAFG